MPYKLLIVEDEDYIREAIVTGLDWGALGFDAREAEDGEIALEVVEEFRPDAVMTDIRMPFVDGLELTARIREKYPETLVVVLSGHDEFKYAQEALSLGVLEYAVKPVLPEALEALAGRLRKRLDERSRRLGQLEQLRTQLTQSLPLLQEKLLLGMMERGMDEPNLRRRLEELGIELKGEAYAVCMFAFSPRYKSDEELTRFALQNVLAEEIGARGVCFNDYEGNQVLLYMILDPENEDRHYLLELVEKLRSNMTFVLGELFPGAVITASLGAAVSSASELHVSYRMAADALGQQILMGRGRVYGAEERSPSCPGEAARHPYREIGDMLYALRFESAQRLDELFASFVEMVKAKKYTKESLKIVFLDIINGVSRTLLDARCGDLPDSSELIGKLQGIRALDEFTPELKAYLKTARGALDRSHTSRSALLIEKVCCYIQNEFGNPSLSLNTAAAQVFISPAYLSILFKRELNTTFTDYVTGLRIERAKALLSNPEFRTYEVASRVGYSDPQYFSNCFKKHTGMTPSEYKKLL